MSREHSEIQQFGEISAQVSRSVDDCVKGNHSECLYEGVITPGDITDPDVSNFETMDMTRFSHHFSFNMDSILPFFCGDSKDCRTLGSQAALNRAKFNVKKKFVTVGVLEFLELSLGVLECKMPHYLKGITKKQMSKKHHENKNFKKTIVSDEVKQVLRSRLDNEYKLYNFIKEELQAQAIECDNNKHLSPWTALN